MGVTVKLKKPKKAELAEQVYEFQSTIGSLRGFGNTMVCQDLLGILDDWTEGLGNELELIDLSTDVIEAAKKQGIIQGLRYFREFLDTLKEIEDES